MGSHKEICIGPLTLYAGLRTNFHVEVGIGAWNLDGFGIWLNLLWLYVGLTI